MFISKFFKLIIIQVLQDEAVMSVESRFLIHTRKKAKTGGKKQNQTTEKQSANIIISKNYFPKSG